MTDKILWPDTPFKLDEHLILVGRRGSEAHGTYIPSEDPTSIDDRDLMGIVVPPAKYYIGLSKWERAESIKECWDVAEPSPHITPKMSRRKSCSRSTSA